MTTPSRFSHLGGVRLDLPLVDITKEIGQALSDWRAEDERAIRWMLGQWVSETEPVLVYWGMTLVGLTFAGIPVGVEAPICVKPPRDRFYTPGREDQLFETRDIFRA